MTEKWFWLFVLAAILIGGFALAVWYAKRQKRRAESATPTGATTSPDFMSGEPHGDLPHAATFSNGFRLYTNIQITARGDHEVRLAGGGVVTSMGNVSGANIKKGQGLVLMDGSGVIRIAIGNSTFKNSKIIIK